MHITEQSRGDTADLVACFGARVSHSLQVRLHMIRRKTMSVVTAHSAQYRHILQMYKYL